MPEAPDLRVLIVHYRAPDLLADCLSALLGGGEVPPGAVLVVDNSPGESGAAKVLETRPGVRLVENSQNIGYAAAINQGMREIEAPFALHLNPDCSIGGNAVRALVEFMKSRPRAGAVTPFLRDPSGSPQEFYSAFPTLPRQAALLTGVRSLFPRAFRARFQGVREEGGSALKADWVIGACLLTRREAFLDVGGMDPDFFFYGEDMDYCFRLKEKGWETFVVLDVPATHVGTRGDYCRSGTSRELLVQWMTRRFFRKRRGAAQAGALAVLQSAASLARWLYWAARFAFRPEEREKAAGKMRVHAECVRGVRPKLK